MFTNRPLDDIDDIVDERELKAEAARLKRDLSTPDVYMNVPEQELERWQDEIKSISNVIKMIVSGRYRRQDA